MDEDWPGSQGHYDNVILGSSEDVGRVAAPVVAVPPWEGALLSLHPTMMAEVRDAEGWPIHEQPTQPPRPDEEREHEDEEQAEQQEPRRMATQDVRGARLDGSSAIARGLQLCIAVSMVLEVLLQLLATLAPSGRYGSTVDHVATIGAAIAIAITTALQVRGALGVGREARSRSELAAALLQVRPALLLWRAGTTEWRHTTQLRGASAGLEQLSPELHRLSQQVERERERRGVLPSDGAGDEASELRQRQHEAVVNASVGTHALLRTVPVASLLALRWWAALAQCTSGCDTGDAAVLQGDGAAVNLIAFSLFSSATTLSLIFTRCCAGELRARAERQPRTDPVCMPGLTFAVLLAGVILTLWTSTVVRMATFSLYVVVFGDMGALATIMVSSLFTACFFQYEKSLGAFLGVLPGTSGLVVSPEEDTELNNGSRICTGVLGQWWFAHNTACQQAGVCLAGMVCPAVDLDLSHPPLSRGSALLIAIRVSELAFLWVVSTGGENGSIPSGPVAAEQHPKLSSSQEEPVAMEDLASDATNMLANCLLACFVMVVLMRLIAYRSRPMVPSRIAPWWPAEWLAGRGRLLVILVAMVCVLVSLVGWLPAVLQTMSAMAATHPYHTSPGLVGTLRSSNHFPSSDHMPPAGCNSWFDGCNSCLVTNAGEITGCTYMDCAWQDTPYCRMFSDGTVCEDVVCSNREQRSEVVEEAKEAQAEDLAAEETVWDLNAVAAEFVPFLVCAWALAMVFPAVRCAC